jgi:hypothetical protein
MKEARAVPREPDAPARPANLTPGIAALLREESPAPKPSTPETVSPYVPADELLAARRLVQLALVVADVLVVCLAVRLVFKTAGPLPLTDYLLAFGSMTTGAALSSLAIWLE